MAMNGFNKKIYLFHLLHLSTERLTLRLRLGGDRRGKTILRSFLRHNRQSSPTRKGSECLLYKSDSDEE